MVVQAAANLCLQLGIATYGALTVVNILGIQVKTATIDGTTLVVDLLAVDNGLLVTGDLAFIAVVDVLTAV